MFLHATFVLFLLLHTISSPLLLPVSRRLVRVCDVKLTSSTRASIRRVLSRDCRGEREREGKSQQRVRSCTWGQFSILQPNENKGSNKGKVTQGNNDAPQHTLRIWALKQASLFIPLPISGLMIWFQPSVCQLSALSQILSNPPSNTFSFLIPASLFVIHSSSAPPSLRPFVRAPRLTSLIPPLRSLPHSLLAFALHAHEFFKRQFEWLHYSAAQNYLFFLNSS